MAVVHLGGDGRPELLLTKPDDFLLQDAKPLGVRACKAIWRPDGKQLVVVRADDCFADDRRADPLRRSTTRRSSSSLKLNGDNPDFQPLAAE